MYKWFLIRAVFGKARQVCDSILALGEDESYEPFMLMQNDEEIFPGMVFVRCTEDDFRRLLDLHIQYLTPYYDWTSAPKNGRKSFVSFPDADIRMLRIIADSGHEDLILNQSIAPQSPSGDYVNVIDGRFAGVSGKWMKFKHQRRVFVTINGLGIFGTSYVPKDWVRKVAS